MNEQISTHPPANLDSKTSRLTVFQWIAVGSAAILGSMISCDIEGRPFGVAEILGGSIFPFAIAMAAALGLKRWRGTVLGVLIIAVFYYFACSAIVHDRHERQKAPQVSR